MSPGLMFFTRLHGRVLAAKFGFCGDYGKGGSMGLF
jgi:hypothetical protein